MRLRFPQADCLQNGLVHSDWKMRKAAGDMHRVSMCCCVLQCRVVECGVLQCVAVRGSLLQCIAVRCGVLQCAEESGR